MRANAAFPKGAAMAKAEAEKTAHYNGMYERNLMKLVVLAWETTGGMSKATQAFFKRLQREIENKDLNPNFPQTYITPTAMTYMMHVIAITIVKYGIDNIKASVEAAKKSRQNAAAAAQGAGARVRAARQ
jgi:hypothetical protein